MLYCVDIKNANFSKLHKKNIELIKIYTKKILFQKLVNAVQRQSVQKT